MGLFLGQMFDISVFLVTIWCHQDGFDDLRGVTKYGV
jgi:hypothetical protein